MGNCPVLLLPPMAARFPKEGALLSMLRTITGRLRSRAGIARATAILLAAVLVMLVVVSIPVYRYYQAQSEKIGCVTALDTARRQLAARYMFMDGNLPDEEAREHITHIMVGWDDLCPGGGDVYLAEDPDGDMPYDIVCGLHDDDLKERTRLNAQNVLDQLRDQLNRRQLYGEQFPAELTVTLNSEELTATLTDEPSTLVRGTSKTMHYRGIIITYSIVGHSDFGADSGLPEGEIWYFSFTDENHCAVWSSLDDWTGDSWRD